MQPLPASSLTVAGEAPPMAAMACNGGGWPEPVVPVQSIAESGVTVVPERYVKPPADRPGTAAAVENINIPLVDLSSAVAGDASAVRAVADACRDWGFFQAVNHGVPPELMRRTLAVWRRFFQQPTEEKLRYANSPATYEGYGSRLGVDPGGPLDWGDYFFLHLRPINPDKWPAMPPELRTTVEEYGKEVRALCERVMTVMSAGLGLAGGRLQEAFGGSPEMATTAVRVNYYPACPQPELTVGLSAHSDPGGMTVLLVHDGVKGLQVRHGEAWVAVQPVAGAFIINVGDQIQVLSNAAYKSVEHRVMVSAAAERLSVAFFYNPKSDIPLGPLPETVNPGRPPLYLPMTFDEYRLEIRRRGLSGKTHLESLKLHAADHQ